MGNFNIFVHNKAALDLEMQ